MAIPFQTDNGIGTRAALGLIVLEADETIEAEFKHYINLEGVSLYHSRVPSGAEVTPETLARMEAEIPRAVSLLPAAVAFDVIGYACTSGATIIGEDNVARVIDDVRPGVTVSNPISAVKEALTALNLHRIAFVTPYIASVSTAMRGNLEDAGFKISTFASFEQVEEKVVARITPQSLLSALLNIDLGTECDGLFISCTNLRTAGIIEEAEQALGIPVISSNQALAWHMLRLAGIDELITGQGRLFRAGLSKGSG